MKSPQVLLAGLLLGIGIGVGIFADRHFFPRPSPAPVAPKLAIAPAPTNTPAIATFTAKDLAAAFESLRNETDMVAFHQAIYPLVERLTPETCPLAMELADGLTKPALRTTARSRIIEQWGQQDNQAALRHLFSLPADAWRDARIRWLLGFWVKENPAAALAWSEQPANAAFSGEVLFKVALARAESDPEGALALAEKMSTAAGRENIQTAVFTAWAKRDPAAAVKRMTAAVPDREMNRRALGSAVAQWVDLDAGAAANWLKEQPDNLRRRQLIRAAAPGFAKAKPAVGLALIQSLPVGEDRQQAIGLFAFAWAKEDANAAFKWARELPAGSERERALNSVLPELAAVNPNAVAEHYLAELADVERDFEFQRFFRDFATRDASAATAWMRKFRNVETRNWALRELAHKTAPAAPIEAIALAKEISEPDAREFALSAVLSIWAGKDPTAAAAHVAKLPAGREHDRFLVSVTGSWIANDLPAAAAWVLSLPAGQGSDDAYRIVINAYVGKNPAQAAAFVEKLPVSEQNIRVLYAVIIGWSKIDLDACAAWVEKLPTPSVRQTAYRALAEQALSVNPARAAAFAENSPPDASRYDDIRIKVALKWAETDPAAASTWALRVATNSQPTQLAAVVQIWGRRDPAAAMKFAAENSRRFYQSDQLAQDRDRSLPYVFASMMTQWAQQDPKAAAAWLAQRESDPNQKELCLTLVGAWPLAQFEDLVKWLNSLPAKPLRDAAVQRLVFQLVGATEYPATFSQLVPMIAAEAERNAAIERIAREWLRKDRDAAQAWLATTKLPEERKAKLLKPQSPK